MINKTNAYFIGILAIFICLLGIQQCSISEAHKEINDLKAVERYKNSQIDSLKNKYNQTVTEANVAEVNNGKIIKDLSQEVFNLKRKDEKQMKEIETLIRINQITRVDSIPVPYVDSIVVIDSTTLNPDSVIIPPRKFKTQSPHYSIEGRVLLKGVELTSVQFPDTLSLRIGQKKTSIFKPKETVIQTIHTNPYVRTEGIQAITVKNEPSRWNRWIKPMIVFGVGLFLGSKL